MKKNISIKLACLALAVCFLTLIGSRAADFVWPQVPFHSFLEAVGSLATIAFAVLLLSSVNKRLSGVSVWFCLGVLNMGVADMFHAMVPPGEAFVWLHSLAIFLGGVFASLVWFEGQIKTKETHQLIAVSLLLVLSSSLVVVLAPGWLPAMIVSGEFTQTAWLLNVVGGLGFLSAAVYFFRLNRTLGERSHILFFFFCVLNASAGLFFKFSSIWDFTWWSWHLLRSTAALFILIYLIDSVRQSFLVANERDQLQALLEQSRQQQDELNKQGWLKNGLSQLDTEMRGGLSMDALSRRSLTCLARYVESPVGALYVNDDYDRFKLAAGYSLTQTPSAKAEFALGQGLVGQATYEKRMLEFTELPEHYLKVVSSLGSAEPNALLVVPLIYNDIVFGVLELGAFTPFSEAKKAFLLQAATPVATAISGAKASQSLQKALEKTQRFAEEMQAQQEELQAANEELEKRSRSLKDRRAELEESGA